MKEYLEKSIDYIDEHIDCPVTLDDIANHIGFSKYYMNQMFVIYTGYSVMAYVRRQKLCHAITLLKSNRRVIDIALEIGYSSERAFSRAMVSTFGHPPSYFRKNDGIKTRKIVIYDLNLDVDEERVIEGLPPTFDKVKKRLREKGIKAMKHYLSKVRYEIIDSMVVLSGTAVGSEPEETIIGLMNQLATFYGIRVLRSFGFDSPVEGTEDVMQFRGYEFWLAIDEAALDKLPSRRTFDFEGTLITVKRIPAYRYAALRITQPFVDPFERIPAGWRHLVSWLEDHDFKAHDFTFCQKANCLEEVKTVGEETVMDIYIPIDTK